MYKEVTEISDASSKNLKSESKIITYDAVETSSKNLKVSRKSSTRSTSDIVLTVLQFFLRCRIDSRPPTLATHYDIELHLGGR